MWARLPHFRAKSANGQRLQGSDRLIVAHKYGPRASITSLLQPCLLLVSNILISYPCFLPLIASMYRCLLEKMRACPAWLSTCTCAREHVPKPSRHRCNLFSPRVQRLAALTCLTHCCTRWHLPWRCHLQIRSSCSTCTCARFASITASLPTGFDPLAGSLRHLQSHSIIKPGL
jgi:hypothetical protein